VRRYVHGPGVDEPLVWYEGTGTSDRRWLHADERGSIVAASNASGTVTNVNREVPMKLWYKFLLLAWALTVIPVVLLGYGFSGGRFVFPDVSEFSPVHLAEFILSGIWGLSPLLLAPFGIRWRKKQPQ